MITAMPRIAIAIHDFPKCLATFRDALGMPSSTVESSRASLGAKVVRVCSRGGAISSSCHLLTQTPAQPQSPEIFLRGGGGLFALCWRPQTRTPKPMPFGSRTQRPPADGRCRRAGRASELHPRCPDPGLSGAFLSGTRHGS
jgi:hypothetical protein